MLNAPTAQGAFIEAKTAAVSQAPVPDGWWKLYDDPTLNGLVAQALTANTDLRVAAANLARARAIAGEADDAGGFTTSFPPPRSIRGSRASNICWPSRCRSRTWPMSGSRSRIKSIWSAV
jgi:hypothetical protein